MKFAIFQNLDDDEIGVSADATLFHTEEEMLAFLNTTAQEGLDAGSVVHALGDQVRIATCTQMVTQYMIREGENK